MATAGDAGSLTTAGGAAAAAAAEKHKPEVLHEVRGSLRWWMRYASSAVRRLRRQGGYATRARLTPTHTLPYIMQSLSLKVDLDTQRVDGQAVLWVVLPGLPPPPTTAGASSDPQHPPEHPPIDFRLHARQMAIGAVRINGAAADFSYPAPPLDLLKGMVPPVTAGAASSGAERSGEALDLHYRCRFLAGNATASLAAGLLSGYPGGLALALVQFPDPAVRRHLILQRGLVQDLGAAALPGGECE